VITPGAHCTTIAFVVGALLAALASAPTARAQSCASYPNTLSNGSTADANQVMANFNCAALLGGANFTGTVGIGTTNPLTNFEAGGTPYFVSNYGGTFPNYGAPIGYQGGTIIGWNGQSTTPGETDFVNFPGGGNGGFDFVQANMSGTVINTPMVITGGASSSGGGRVGIGTLAPSAPLTVINTGSAVLIGGTGGAIAPAALAPLSVMSANGGSSSNWYDPANYTTYVMNTANGVEHYGLLVSDYWRSSENYVFAVDGRYYVNGTITGDTHTPAFIVRGDGTVGVETATPSYNFYVNGSSGGTQGWTNTSDARLKTNITDIPDALDIVDHLRGVRFRWRPPSEREVGKELTLPLDEPQIGFLAQEVAKVVPEAVTAPKAAKGGPYGVKDSSIVPILVEAIKAQQAEVKAQQAEIQELQAEVAALKSPK
jgi:hypothetical protein